MGEIAPFPSLLKGLFKVPGKHVEKFHVNGLNKNFTQWQRFSPHGFQKVFHFSDPKRFGKMNRSWNILSNIVQPYWPPAKHKTLCHRLVLPWICLLNLLFCFFCEFWALSAWYIVKCHTLFSWLMGATPQAAVSQKRNFVTDWIDQNKYPL